LPVVSFSLYENVGVDLSFVRGLRDVIRPAMLWLRHTHLHTCMRIRILLTNTEIKAHNTYNKGNKNAVLND